MAHQFITKTRLTSQALSTSAAQTTLERYEELQALLLDHAGPEVAGLFAEPLLNKGNDVAAGTVSWYTSHEGEPRPLSAVSPAERSRAEIYLVEHLRPLRGLMNTPAHGELIKSALDFDDDFVWVVDGLPVLVNWGMLPAGAAADPSVGSAHFAAGIGQFFPQSPTLSEPAAAVAPPTENVQAPTGSATPPPSGAQTGAQTIAPAAPSRVPAIAWVPLVVLLLIAGAALIWILLPGNRLFPWNASVQAVTDQDALAAARAHNAALRERRAVLNKAIENAVCRADGTLVLPDGRTPDGLLPYSPRSEEGAPSAPAEVPQDALLPSHTDRIVVPDPNTPADTDSEEIPLLALSEMIEARTVLVLAVSASGVEVGSGFSIGNGMIVTNHHVVEKAASDGGIYVMNKTLGRPIETALVKGSGPLETTGDDYALLQMQGATLPGFSILNPQGSLKLNNVVAAGYPADMMEIDSAFADFQAGNVRAVPELTLTDGTVNAEQDLGARTSVLMHSAALSTGNSGGPLVDMCGRVVGVNTFVRTGRLQNRNFALATSDLLRFIGDATPPIVETAQCAPTVLRPGVEFDKPDEEETPENTTATPADGE